MDNKEFNKLLQTLRPIDDLQIGARDDEIWDKVNEIIECQNTIIRLLKGLHGE